MSNKQPATSEYKGLYAQSTDNEDEDYPPQFTTLATELEKCKLLFNTSKATSSKFKLTF